MVSGQDTPMDLALQQRCVTVRLKKDGATGTKFLALNAMIGEMGGIMPVLAERFVKKKEQLEGSIKKMRDYLRGKGLDDRTAITYGIVMGTYDLLLEGENKKFLDFCVTHAEESFAEKEAEKPTTQFLEAIGDLKARRMIQDCVRQTGGQLAIHFSAVFSAWEEMLGRRKRDFSFKPRTLLKEFSEEPYFVDASRRVWMGKSQQRALILDPKLDELVMDIFENAEGE